MRKLLLFLIVSLFGGVVVSAQTPDSSNPEEYQKPYDAQTFCERLTNLNNKNLDTEYEFRLGWVGNIELPSFLNPDRLSEIGGNSVGVGADYYNSLTKRGALVSNISPQLEFVLRRTKRFSLGLGVYYASNRQNIYNTVTSAVEEPLGVDILAFRPTLRWEIVRWQWLRFYLSTGFNIYLANDKNKGAFCESEYFIGYGYTIGNRVFFFQEGCLSNDGYINIMGVGYRF